MNIALEYDWPLNWRRKSENKDKVDSAPGLVFTSFEQVNY